MSYLRIISISTVLLFQPITSSAENVDQDLQRCASAALQERQQSATVISINAGGLKRHELDHDVSRGKSKYRMLVTNKTSGEDLGSVTCTLSRSGDLIAAAFDL